MVTAASDGPNKASEAGVSQSRFAPNWASRSMWIGIGAGALVIGSVVAAVVVGGRSPTDAVESIGRSSIPTSVPTLVATTRNTATTLVDAPDPSTTIAVSTLPPSTTTSVAPLAIAPPQDIDDPSVVARPVPVDPPPPPPEAPPPPWAASTHTTSAGLISTGVGCADDLSAAGLDRFFAQRIGPVLGWDYQHVTALGGDRFLWLFQDTFIDHSGTASTLDKASFSHNAALLQEGRCFSLLHRGTTSRPQPFERGTGTTTLSTWFWPMGGEVHNGELHVVWVQMVKDAFDPNPPDGLGWHPAETWIATYDVNSLTRLDFRRAPNSGVAPIYGYAMVSDSTHTYMFGNSFEQNLSREGGYWNGPHSATRMYLARVPRGQVFSTPEYRTADGWSDNPAESVPILSRHWAEFPMQPRIVDGQWVAVAAVDSYWDELYTVDVANDPWGPWVTVESRRIAPRNTDPKMNTYHAHLLPWRDGFGQLVVSISNNARNMFRDAWPHPERYRPLVFTSPWVVAPPPTTLPPTTTTLPPPTSTTSTTSTTLPPTTTTSTSTLPTTTTSTTTTTSSTTTSSSTTVPDSTSTTSSTTEPDELDTPDGG